MWYCIFSKRQNDDKVKEEKVFLIVSGSLGQYLVPQIEHDIKLDIELISLFYLK